MTLNQKEAMDIDKEINNIGEVVKKFEDDLRKYLVSTLDDIVAKNENVSITIKSDMIVFSDYIDAEQVDYFIYIDDEYNVQIEATKQGFSIGYLENDNETYVKITTLLKPILDTCKKYFSWDGREFVTNLK